MGRWNIRHFLPGFLGWDFRWGPGQFHRNRRALPLPSADATHFGVPLEKTDAEGPRKAFTYGAFNNYVTMWYFNKMTTEDSQFQ